MTERDTHFQDSANTLCNDEKLSHFLENPNVCTSGMRDEIVTLIAQYAYDVAFHTLSFGDDSNVFLFNRGERKVEDIVPDMEERPEIPEYDW